MLAFEAIESEPNEQAELNLQLKDEEIAFLFFDIPNGEATLIKTTEHSILVGTGSNDSIQALQKRLTKFHINHIDTIILPRFEDEYAGNTHALIERFHVRNVIVPAEGKEMALKEFDKEGVEISGWEEGGHDNLIPNLLVEVLPGIQTLTPNLSMDINFKGHHVLIASEANEHLEKKWLPSLNKINVLKVAEFGLSKEMSQSFLDIIDPQVAILFAKENSQPNPQILERMQETWIDTYQTRQNGTILIKANANDYKLITIHFKD